MSAKIRLTFPPTHSDADIECLFHDYGRRFPDKLAAWIEVEKAFIERSRMGEEVEDSPQNPLRQISSELLGFLKEQCEFDSTFALSTAAFDVRYKVRTLAKQKAS